MTDSALQSSPLTPLQIKCAERKEEKKQIKERAKARKRGRPPKRKKKKGVIGRPKGEAGIMKEYRERMLNSPRSKLVLDTIFKAALDNEHKNQAAAWKIVVDRIVPVSGFDKIAQGTTRSAITVNISGVPGVQIDASGGPEEAPEEPLEGEFTEVDAQ